MPCCCCALAGGGLGRRGSQSCIGLLSGNPVEISMVSRGAWSVGLMTTPLGGALGVKKTGRPLGGVFATTVMGGALGSMGASIRA